MSALVFRSTPATPTSSSPSLPAAPYNTPASGTLDANGNANTDRWMASCLPNFFGLPFPFWRSSRQHSASAVETNHNNVSEFEISLETISVNFKVDYIGGGNQSSVFRGVLHGNTVAIKKLNRATEVDIKMLKSLQHPNVIETIGICTEDICPCIVMEYCEQGGLYDVLQRRAVTKSLFCKWSREIAAGMAYLHSQKIIHRDLKTPNILVDRNDCIKICDFGSLYTFDRTFMPSVVMTFVGTSQYMPPEMMKNQPCNEKVDVWSFGVVLWELMTQEKPYDGIQSMAVMYGVGSGKLNLHIPSQAPHSIKNLLRQCWCLKPRNRPSFNSVLSHLNNLEAEVSDMSEDAWQMRKEVWKREIRDEARKTRGPANCGNGSHDGDCKEDELVQKRMHELRHAQEIREMYEKKMQRVDKFMNKVVDLLGKISAHERELEFASASNGSITSGPKQCRVMRPVVVKAKGATEASNHEYESYVHNRSAVVAMEEDSDSDFDAVSTSATSFEGDVEDADAAPMTTRHLPSCVSEHSFVKPRRSPKSGGISTSQSDKNIQAHCACCMYQFQRNCVARISGISADSGVCSSTFTLEETTGQRLHNYALNSPLNRAVESRWSDGRLHSAVRRKPRRQNSRESPGRPSPSANKTPLAAIKRRSSLTMIESVNVEIIEDELGQLQLIDLDANTPKKNPTPARRPRLIVPTRSVDEDDGDDEAMEVEADEEGPVTVAPPTNPAAKSKRVTDLRDEMTESSSTMVSSLERSLELAVGLSDGLSDKECKLKEAKSHFKTHRRTASNPVYPVVTETTSTESDNEAVYC